MRTLAMKSRAAIAGAICACAVTVRLAVPQTPVPSTKPELPFTISNETTAITSPLKANGTPDYVAALNAKYSHGVTPENNGYALFLQKITGTRKEDGVIAEGAREKLLEM